MPVAGEIALLLFIAFILEAVQQLLSVQNLLLIFRFKAPTRLLFRWILNYWTTSLLLGCMMYGNEGRLFKKRKKSPLIGD